MKRHIVCAINQMDNVFGKTTSGARLLTVDELTIGTVTLTQQYSTVPYQLKLPQTQGASNSFLSNNGSGLLTWKTESSLPFIDEVGITTPSFLSVTNSPITSASISPTITIGLSGTALPTSSGGTGSTAASTGTGGVVLRTDPEFTTQVRTPRIEGSGLFGDLTLQSDRNYALDCDGIVAQISDEYMFIGSRTYLDIRGGLDGTVPAGTTNDIFMSATRSIFIGAPTSIILGGNSYPLSFGTNGQVLTTNGAGSLSWQTPSGGGGGGGVSSVGMSVPAGGFLEVNSSTSATITTTGTFGITLGTLPVANGGTGVTTATGTGAVVRKIAPTLEDAMLDAPEIADPNFTTDVVINEEVELNNNFTVNHTAVGETNFNLGADGKFKISANSPSLASFEAITCNLIGASTFSVVSSGLGLINLISSGAGGILVKSSGTGNIDIETLGIDIGTGASVNLKAEGVGANVTLKSTGTGSISLTSALLPSIVPSTITLNNTTGNIQIRTLKPATGGIQLISASQIDVQAIGVISVGPAVSIELESAINIRLSGPLSAPSTLITLSAISISITGAVGITGAITTTGAATVGGVFTASGTSTLTGAVTANGALTVTGLITSNGALTSAGLITANGALTVSGLTTANGAITASGLITANGALTVNGLATANGIVTITGPAINYFPIGVGVFNVLATGALATNFVGVGGSFKVETGGGGIITIGTVGLGTISMGTTLGECKIYTSLGNMEITSGGGRTAVTSDSGNVVLSTNAGAIFVIASQGGLNLGAGITNGSDRLCRISAITSNGSGVFEEGDVSFQTRGRGGFTGSCNFTVDTTLGYVGRIAHWSKGNFEIASNLNGLSRATRTVNLNTSFLTSSYSFNFPTTSGTTGQVFTSGGSSNALSWTTTTGLDNIVRQRDPDFYNSINLYDYGSPGAGHFLSIYPSQVMTAPFALTLPPNSGTAGQILTTSGAAGILSWENPTFPGILPVANGGTGSSSPSTGTGGVVLQTSPTFLTDLATPVIYGSGSLGDLTIQSARNLYLAGTSNGLSLPSSIVSLLSGGYINISAGDFGGSNDLYLSASRIIYLSATDIRLGPVFYPTNVGTLGQVLTLTNVTVGAVRASWVTPNVSIISGTLGIANGGTGLSTIGANGTVLSSNGTTASWVTPAAPGTGTVTSVAVASGNSFLTVSGSPITNSGTITVGIAGPLTTNFGGTGSTSASTGTGGVVLEINPQFTTQLRTPKVVGSGTSGNLAITSAGTIDIANDGWIYLNSNWNLGSAPIGSIRGFAFGWNNSGADGENILTYYTGAGSNPRLDICSWNGSTRTTRLTIDNSGALCTPSIKGTGTSGDLTMESARDITLSATRALILSSDNGTFIEGAEIYANNRRIDLTNYATYGGSSPLPTTSNTSYKPSLGLIQSLGTVLNYNSSNGDFMNLTGTEILITVSYSCRRNSNGFGITIIGVELNGAGVLIGTTTAPPSGTEVPFWQSGSCVFRLLDGDFFRLIGYQTSGSGNDFHVDSRLFYKYDKI